MAKQEKKIVENKTKIKAKVIKPDIYTIDAQDKILGRLAVQIALLLRGKQKSNFLPYQKPQTKVFVKNVEKIKFTGQKLLKKTYFRYTGYPGGLRQRKLGEIFSTNPKWVLRHAVLGMLPKNKLRKKMINNLYFA